MATRQSQAFVSARASGAMMRMPSPMPADTRATARPRRVVNHLVVVAVSVPTVWLSAGDADGANWLVAA